MLLRFDQAELLIIHEHVRMDRNAPAFGQEHDAEFMQRIRQAVLRLEAPDKKGYPTEVELSRGECLQLTRQVSVGIVMGQRPIGKEILLKVFAALENEGDTDDVPAIFRDGFAGEDDALSAVD